MAVNKRQRLDFAVSLSPWKSKLLSIKVSPLIQKAVERMKHYDDNPNEFSAYGKDVRSDRDKAYDLVEGWFFEDCLIEILNVKLKSLNYTARPMGCDADRVIKISDQAIDSEPDIGIFDAQENLIQAIELKTAHKWFDNLHIKSNNLEALKKHPQTMLIFWFLESNEIVCLSLADFNNRALVPNPAWNNKECYLFSKNEMKAKSLGILSSLDWSGIITRFKSQSLREQMGMSQLQKT